MDSQTIIKSDFVRLCMSQVKAFQAKQTLIVGLWLLLVAPVCAQRIVSVSLAGLETKVGSEVFAMGELQENEDGSAILDLYDMKKNPVGRYEYRKFGELPVKRDFQYEGESYLHLPVMTGDTLYRHRKYMWGVQGKFSTFKGHYELWASRSRAEEYGKVVVKDGIVEISWYDMKSDSLRAVCNYSSITPTTVKLEGAQTKFHKSTGEVFSRISYEKDVKTAAEYFDTKGNPARKYTYGKNGAYELWQYFAPKKAEDCGALKRHEVCGDKESKPKGELYDEQGAKLKFVPYEVDPQYPGGQAKLLEVIRKKLRYPKEAAKDRVQGRVMLEFFIDSIGNISNIEVLQSPHHALSEEAIRVVKDLKPFNPGMRDGKPVKIKYMLPVNFYLN